MRAHSTILAALAASVVLGCAGDGAVAPADDPNAPPSPVGTFVLSTVNGEPVPMMWDEMELWKGGPVLRAYWNGGSIQFRSDSTYTASFRHSLTGPNLPGNIQEDTYTGTWRLDAGARIELRANNGAVQLWQTTNRIDSITKSTSVPSLDGGEEQVVFVFVRR